MRRITAGGDAVREVGDDLCRRGVEGGEVELDRVGEVQRGVRVGVERVAQRRFEPAVELDHVNVRGPVGEVLRQHAESAADLEHDVVGVQRRGAADDVEDVRVDQEVLAQLAVRPDPELPHPAQARLRRELAHHLEEPGGVGLHRRLELLVGDAAALGDEAGGVDHVRRLVAVLADLLRRQVRGVGLDEQPVERDALGGLRQVLRLRVRDVAGERDPPAVVEALVEPVGHREAVQHDLEPVRVLGQRGDRVVLGRARVDDERLPELARDLDVVAERALLVGARRVVAVVVEPGLADRQAAGVRARARGPLRVIASS